jgi:hypothetical protein
LKLPRRIEEEAQVVEEKVAGELWWVFQHVDMAVDAMIRYFDQALGHYQQPGTGAGHRVMKLVLLVVPFVVTVLIGGFWVLSGGCPDELDEKII